MDRNEPGEIGEMGEIGGVGGSRNVSPVGIVTGGLVSLPMNICPWAFGVDGGERTLTRGTFLIKSWEVGGDLYVIPMAPCRPARSRFWGIKATVTSPSRPLGCTGGTGIRITDCFPVMRGSSHRLMVRILLLSK